MSRRENLFDAIRPFANRYSDPQTIVLVNKLADHLGLFDEPARKVNAKGLKLMREFEGCRLEAYPDPGSRDGNPWTIGYGATGPGIHKGVKWTQQQCEERHEQDVARFAAGVDKLLGDVPTTADQFSALVAFAYNVGLNALRNSTLLRMHKAGDYAGAAAQFARWNKNDGKPMRGLTRRREAEARLYRGEG